LKAPGLRGYYVDMRFLVTGDCYWVCYELALNVLRRLIDRYGADITIVHGGATGVDESFARACRELDMTAEPHIAEWRWHGNTAGPKRNRAMVEAGAEMCIALHRDIKSCRDTKDCVRQALAAKIPTYLIDDDQGIPTRLVAGDKRLK
jgi:hypothetical protein